MTRYNPGKSGHVYIDSKITQKCFLMVTQRCMGCFGGIVAYITAVRVLFLPPFSKYFMKFKFEFESLHRNIIYFTIANTFVIKLAHT